MIAPAIIVGAEVALLLLQEVRGWREDQRALQSGQPLPPLEPLPDSIKEAAAEYAKAHGLPLPDGE